MRFSLVILLLLATALIASCQSQISKEAVKNFLKEQKKNSIVENHLINLNSPTLIEDVKLRLQKIALKKVQSQKKGMRMHSQEPQEPQVTAETPEVVSPAPTTAEIKAAEQDEFEQLEEKIIKYATQIEVVKESPDVAKELHSLYRVLNLQEGATPNTNDKFKKQAGYYGQWLHKSWRTCLFPVAEVNAMTYCENSMSKFGANRVIICKKFNCRSCCDNYAELVEIQRKKGQALLTLDLDSNNVEPFVSDTEVALCRAQCDAEYGGTVSGPNSGSNGNGDSNNPNGANGGANGGADGANGANGTNGSGANGSDGANGSGANGSDGANGSGANGSSNSGKPSIGDDGIPVFPEDKKCE